MDFIPDRSEIQIEDVEVKKDQVLKQMIRDLNVKHLVPGMKQKEGGKRRERDTQQWAVSFLWANTSQDVRHIISNWY